MNVVEHCHGEACGSGALCVCPCAECVSADEEINAPGGVTILGDIDLWLSENLTDEEAGQFGVDVCREDGDCTEVEADCSSCRSTAIRLYGAVQATKIHNDGRADDDSRAKLERAMKRFLGVTRVGGA